MCIRLLRDKNVNSAALEKVQKYEEDLAKIQAATHINDFDKLVDTFIKNEEKNFATFKFVNEQSNEIETLEKTIAELKVVHYFALVLTDIRKKNQSMKDKEHNKMLSRRRC